MPTKSLETLRQHGIKGYQLGCKCEECHDAKLRVGRGFRDRQRAASGCRLVPCPFCGRSFTRRGLATHDFYCTG